MNPRRPRYRAFGARLSELRRRRGHSVPQLAALIGVHRSGLLRLEGGYLEPRSDTLRALADALGVSMDSLWRDPA